MKLRHFIPMHSTPAIRLLASLFLLSASAAFPEGPSPLASSIGLFAGSSVSMPINWTPEDPALTHFGFSAGGGADLRLGRIIAARLESDFFWIGSSSLSPLGIVYRPWEGLRFSLSAGYSFGPGSGTWRIGVLAGGALTAARYSDTSLIFAYPSILAKAELGLPLGTRGALRLGLPLELMLRGDSRTLSPGLSAAYAYDLPIGGRP